MELDKTFIKEEILTIPGIREAIRDHKFDEVFKLCKNTKKRQQLALSLYLARVEFLPYMTSIPESLFRGISEIKDVSIPGNIKEIGDLAFFNSGLENVEFGEGVEKIGSGAFAQTGIKEVHLPKSIKELGENCLGRAKVFCFITDVEAPAYSWGNFTVNTVSNEETKEIIKERS